MLIWTSGKGYTRTTTGNQEESRSTEIIPIRGMHYKLPVLGYRFGNIAYCTDMNLIPEEEFEKLQKKVMRVDFSWKKSALSYLELYNQF